jgi:hypothetical protein
MYYHLHDIIFPIGETTMPRTAGPKKEPIHIRLLTNTVDRMRWILRNPTKTKNLYAKTVVNYGSVNSLIEQLLQDWMKDVLDKLPPIDQIRRDLYSNREGKLTDE